jgi:hypothetical protein
LDFGFWIDDFGFWIDDFGLTILDFGLTVLDFGLTILDLIFFHHNRHIDFSHSVINFKVKNYVSIVVKKP